MDHGIVAMSPCKVALARHSDLKSVTEAKPQLTRLLWLDTLVDGAIHREWLVAMGRRSTKSHLAHLLCEPYVRLKVVEMVDGEDIAFGVLTEETVRSSDLKPLAAWIARQPSWSDLPFIVLTQRGGGPERNPSAARLSDILGNVTFLERPFHPTTFISVARTALKGRRRQYEARARLNDLADGERRLQAALEAGRLGSWELDLRTNDFTTSAVCRSIFGLPTDRNFSYENLLAAIHRDDRARVERAMSGTVETGRDCELDFKYTWPNGTVHWIEIRAQLFKNLNRSGQKLVGIASDVTARRASEDALKSVNDMLEERVALRTAELNAANAGLIEEVHSAKGLKNSSDKRRRWRSSDSSLAALRMISTIY